MGDSAGSIPVSRFEEIPVNTAVLGFLWHSRLAMISRCCEENASEARESGVRMSLSALPFDSRC